VSGGEHSEPADLGFRWRRFKNGDVEIRRDGRVVTVLRGSAADRFVAAVGHGDPQQVMARATGNYRRGNESLSARR
jgi:hypothetical protein